MKKFTFLMTLALIISAANAQEQGQKTLRQFEVVPMAFSKINATQRSVQDEEQLIMNWTPDTEEWTNVAYYSITNHWGWVCGTNEYGMTEDAERFDLTGSGKIFGIYLLAHATSDNDRSVTLKIYDDASGFPGNALYTQSVPLSTIPDFDTYVIDLDTPFPYTPGTYYVSFAFNYTSPMDSFVVFNQFLDYSAVGNPGYNTAYQMWQGDWYTIAENWGSGDDNWNLFVGLVVQTTDNVPNINGNNKVNISQNDGQVNVTVSENSTVRVLDLTGKLMGTYYATPNSTLSINQQAGLYLFEVKSSSGTTTQKVLVR